MKAFRPVVVCAALAIPALANAQAAGDRPAKTFEEIERGLYFSVLGGPFFVVNPPASSGPRPFSPGQMAQVELGVDIGERLSLGAFVMAASNRAGSEYVGNSGGAASGDFSTLVPGVVARFHLVGLADAQEVQRTWIYVRGGAGYALFRPKQLLPDSDILVFAGSGLEYYTRLRHFSVGIEVTGSFFVKSQSFGFAVTPNLRYAF
ncbi:adventurous gliding motility protein CglE [Archangium sp.]|uniref:adventurous gliding motility protein CglE n=1 Tax=Archangium sp. TaxID=1872627 RepID=UPI002D5F9015|nr:adventurous gliding motility protein CglE [Archangium sp.]HYO52779.1 adventurous gliding motility protein CglE [Archangium sp.]